MKSMIGKYNKYESRLTLIKEVEPIVYKRGKARRGLYKCSCGNEKVLRMGDVNFGSTKSCGCLRKESLAKITTTHGAWTKDAKEHDLKLYSVWYDMKKRCNGSRKQDARWYYEKGIRVCKEWVNDFTVFRNWALNAGYQPGLSIDRIDSNGNYEPSNCQWITISENSKKATTKHGRYSKFN